MSDDEDDYVSMSPVEDVANPEINPAPTSKRKREIESKSERQKSGREPSKKQRVNNHKNGKTRDRQSDEHIDNAIAHMDSRLLADHFAQRCRKFQPDLSVVELEDMYIPEKAIIDTSSWDKPRTTETLPAFLEIFTDARRKKKGNKLVNASQQKGHPHTLVIAGAALRAVDLRRSLREYQSKDVQIAKLFAKHIKFKEAVEAMKQSRVNIGVGTPQRIFDLIEAGALFPAHLERIVIDASYIDLKKRGVLDMRETLVPLQNLLAREELSGRYSDGSSSRIELLFF